MGGSVTHEEILSVGVDIGTSTTQLIFSRLTIENRASSYAAPRIQIVKKEVVHRSQIYFTPLRSSTEIDAEAVKKILQKEYASAGIQPKDVKTGAVIITGETARKQNANQVLEALASLAGDFVVATAGPDLESVLSARGAGTDQLSQDQRLTMANLDVGGGTTNIGVFEKGKLTGVCCLDIGGRLIRVENGRIAYVYHKIQKLAQSHGIQLGVGDRADPELLGRVCGLMADQLAQALHCRQADGFHRALYTNDGKSLPENPPIQGITYSGGVADCIYNKMEGDPFRYGDVGVLLGQAIRENKDLAKLRLFHPAETIRATVVGAGTHTTEVSGSTIHYVNGRLPVKNVPVLKVSQEDEASLETLREAIRRQLPLYQPEGRAEQIALAFSGKGYTRFAQIQGLAAAITEGMGEVIHSGYPLIVVVEADIGKVLGNAINLLLDFKKDVICIDGIRTQAGDYVDIGEPVAEGHVVPVVVKTLIFNS